LKLSIDFQAGVLRRHVEVTNDASWCFKRGAA
jgi:hypothetical protein